MAHPTHETAAINTETNYIDEQDLDPEEEDLEAEEEEEEEIEEEEDESESVLSESTWISSFCSMLGHEYFAEVTEDFIEDDFNLTNLSSMVPMYKEALEMILDVEPEPSSSEEEGGEYTRNKKFSANDNLSIVESSSELLYGLIHQRYILSRQGMQQMYDKYLAAHFGHCPRVYCNNARVLPCGSSDTPCVDTVKLYCPCCMDVYLPPNSRFQTVDGAYFGTSFASLFLMTYGDVDVSTASHKTPGVIPPAKKGTAPGTGMVNGFAVQNVAPGLGQGKMYDMKIYGFKVSERSKSGPRMKWLRSKPEDVMVLDEAARKAAGKTRRRKKSKGGDVEMGDAEFTIKGGLPETVMQETTEAPRRVMKKPVRRLREEAK